MKGIGSRANKSHVQATKPTYTAKGKIKTQAKARRVVLLGIYGEAPPSRKSPLILSKLGKWQQFIKGKVEDINGNSV